MYKISKTLILPSTTEPNTIYLVKSGMYFDIYITDNENNLVPFNYKQENYTKLLHTSDTHYSSRLKLVIPGIFNYGTNGTLSTYTNNLLGIYQNYHMFDKYYVVDTELTLNDINTATAYIDKLLAYKGIPLAYMKFNSLSDLNITNVVNRVNYLIGSWSPQLQYMGAVIHISSFLCENLESVVFSLKYLKFLLSQQFICPMLIYLENSCLNTVTNLVTYCYDNSVCDAVIVSGSWTDFTTKQQHINFLKTASPFKGIALYKIDDILQVYSGIIAPYCPSYLLAVSQSVVDPAGSTSIDSTNIFNIKPDINNIEGLVIEINKGYYQNNTMLPIFMSDTVPVGAIMYVAAANKVPTNWLYCNGAQLSRLAYTELFNAIGYTFGGSGNVFNLPDLRGVFIRGWDDGRGLDPNREYGSYQIDTVGQHRHKLNVKFRDAYDVSCNKDYLRVDRAYITGCTNTTYVVSPKSSNDQFIYQLFTYTNDNVSETRPKNIALYPIIKYTNNTPPFMIL